MSAGERELETVGQPKGSNPRRVIWNGRTKEGRRADNKCQLDIVHRNNHLGVSSCVHFAISFLYCDLIFV